VNTCLHCSRFWKIAKEYLCIHCSARNSEDIGIHCSDFRGIHCSGPMYSLFAAMSSLFSAMSSLFQTVSRSNLEPLNSGRGGGGGCAGLGNTTRRWARGKCVRYGRRALLPTRRATAPAFRTSTRRHVHARTAPRIAPALCTYQLTTGFAPRRKRLNYSYVMQPSQRIRRAHAQPPPAVYAAGHPAGSPG
jgi:hypothetical protein